MLPAHWSDRADAGCTVPVPDPDPVSSVLLPGLVGSTVKSSWRQAAAAEKEAEALAAVLDCGHDAWGGIQNAHSDTQGGGDAHSDTQDDSEAARPGLTARRRFYINRQSQASRCVAVGALSLCDCS